MNRVQLLFCLFGICASFFIDTAQGRSARRLEGEGIVGGDLANEGQFPYQVSLQVNGEHICGGSILSERYILTAAHCVIGADNSFTKEPLKVIAGTSDLKSNSATKVAIDVVEVYVPKEYDDTSEVRRRYYSTGDIAIVKLNKDLKIKRKLNTAKISLPKSYKTYEGKKAIVSGFGDNKLDLIQDPKTRKYKEINHQNDGKLRFAEVNVWSYEKCRKSNTIIKIDISHMCAAVTQRDKLKPEGVCSGDSGGPLVYKGVQIGVLANSPYGCHEDVHPALYTRVSDYLDFIRKVVTGKINGSIRKLTLQVKV